MGTLNIEKVNFIHCTLNVYLTNPDVCFRCFRAVPRMGPQEDYIETVLTCEGDFYDPEFHQQLHNFSKRLQELITSGTYDSFHWL